MEASVRPGALLHFPSTDDRTSSGSARVVPFSPAARVADTQPAAELTIRLAVYPSPQAALPAVYDLSASDPGALLADACDRTARLVQEQGGLIPAEAVVAVVENLIHAHFHLAAVSIAADGTVTVSDQGPGIPDKERAVLPGFTTATAEMRRYIRGIGSGLTIAKQLMDRLGGSLSIEDNLAGGTVVTLHPPHPSHPLSAARPPAPGPSRAVQRTARAAPPPPQRLSPRQQRLLLLLADADEIGPSAVSQHLGLSLTTAFRELVALEAVGLVASDGSGKRRLTAAGIAAVERLLREEMGDALRRG